MTRGPVERLEAIFGPVDQKAFLRLSRALAEQETRIAALDTERGTDTGLPWRATFDQSAFVDGRGSNPFLQCRPEHVGPLFAGGASIQLGALESLVFGADDDARLARAAELLRAELHHPGLVQVGATLSPPGAGFAPHFDPTGAFLVQTSGRKRYRVAHRPLVEWPRGKAYLTTQSRVRYRTAQGRAAEAWELPEAVPEPLFDEEVELAPGDVLYLPPGVVHATAASAETVSVALLLIFGQTSPRVLLASALEAALSHDPAWRHLPVFTDPACSGELPPHVAAYVDARIAEAIGYLQTLRGDGFELGRLWKKLSSDSLSLGRARRDDAPIARATSFVVPRWVREQLAVGERPDGTRVASLFRGTTELAAEGALASMLATLARSDRFVAGDAVTDGCTWEEAEPCLRELLCQGFLERARGLD